MPMPANTTTSPPRHKHHRYHVVCHGSIMLFGEHAILYGAEAICCAIDQSLSLTLHPHDNDVILIRSRLGNIQTTLSDWPKALPESFNYLRGVFTEMAADLPTGFTLDIDSDQLSHQHGFSSSACITAGALSLLYTFAFGVTLTKVDLLKKSLSIIHRVTGNKGSGYDLAACIYGGVIKYNPQTLHVTPLKTIQPLTLIYCGYKTKTPVVIDKIEQRIQTNPTRYQAIFDQIGVIVAQAEIAIGQQDNARLGQLMQENHALLVQLGVNDAVIDQIYTTLIQKLKLQGAKISGAGLGDCLLALGQVDPNAFIDQAKDGISVIKTQVYDEGLKILKTPLALTKEAVVKDVLANVRYRPKKEGRAFAPVNFALAKYWGKRNDTLHLPITDSLSLSIDHVGTHTTLCEIDHPNDIIIVNGQTKALHDVFCVKLIAYLNLFRPTGVHYKVDTHSDLAIASGLASSASGFAALIKALNALYQWQLSPQQLSILARLGSGSACRSVYFGFVLWQRGQRADGMDSHAIALSATWPEITIGLLVTTDKTKAISSREGMAHTVNTSPLYSQWPNRVAKDIKTLKRAIEQHAFDDFGQCLEANATFMHQSALAATPPVDYDNVHTKNYKTKIQALRKKTGLSVYFTQDAGPHLKLIYLKQDESTVRQHFPLLESLTDACEVDLTTDTIINAH